MSNDPTTDTPDDDTTATDETPGERLDVLIGELRGKADDLHGALEEAGNEFRDDFAQMIDSLSAKIDEVQAEWDERRGE